MRVEDRAKRFSVRGIDCHTKRFPLFNFIPKPFVDQNIRVHSDSQAEDKASNAGKCQNAVEHAQHANHHDAVDQQSDVRNETDQSVINDHEHDHQDKARNS